MNRETTRPTQQRPTHEPDLIVVGTIYAVSGSLFIGKRPAVMNADDLVMSTGTIEVSQVIKGDPTAEIYQVGDAGGAGRR